MTFHVSTRIINCLIKPTLLLRPRRQKENICPIINGGTRQDEGRNKSWHRIGWLEAVIRTTGIVLTSLLCPHFPRRFVRMKAQIARAPSGRHFRHDEQHSVDFFFFPSFFPSFPNYQFATLLVFFACCR